MPKFNFRYSDVALSRKDFHLLYYRFGFFCLTGLFFPRDHYNIGWVGPRDLWDVWCSLVFM